MIYSAEHTKQPLSGEYIEKIYDVEKPFKSAQWTWIKFIDETGEWYGEFRGEYRGLSVSANQGLVVVLTSDCMYIFDKDAAKIIENDMYVDFEDITTSPKGDILLTDRNHIEILINKDGHLETDVVKYYPITPDELNFIAWSGNVLKISCYEFLKWEEVELYFDCDTMDWVGNTINVEANKPLSFKEKLFHFLKRLR